MLKRSLLVTAFALVSCGAIAADRHLPLPVPLPVKAPTYVDIWSGLYFGVNGSYNQETVVCCGLKDKPSGIMFGPTLGYRKVLSNNLVLGGEADIDFGSVDKVLALSKTASANFKTKTEGSARVVVGYLISPVAMVYGTGGVAFSDNRVTFSAPGTALSDHEHPYGLTYGAGLEYKLGNLGNIVGTGISLNPASIKFEYRHDDFGRTMYGFGAPIAIGPKIKDTDNRVVVGINYQY